MSKSERDTLVDGECITSFGKRGILFKVVYKKSKIQITGDNGLIWFDIESAHGLSLAPENYKSISDDNITRWVKENIKGKPIDIVSHVRIGFTPELKREYEKVTLMLGNFEPNFVPFLQKFIQAFPDSVSNDGELQRIIKNSIANIFIRISATGPYKEKLDKLKPLVDELTKFTSNFMHHFGFNRGIIIPVIGDKSDSRFHNLLSAREGQPKQTICMVMGVGLIDTSNNQVLKKASVSIFN